MSKTSGLIVNIVYIIKIINTSSRKKVFKDL